MGKSLHSCQGVWKVTSFLDTAFGQGTEQGPLVKSLTETISLTFEPKNSVIAHNTWNIRLVWRMAISQEKSQTAQNSALCSLYSRTPLFFNQGESGSGLEHARSQLWLRSSPDDVFSQHPPNFLSPVKYNLSAWTLRKHILFHQVVKCVSVVLQPHAAPLTTHSPSASTVCARSPPPQRSRSVSKGAQPPAQGQELIPRCQFQVLLFRNRCASTLKSPSPQQSPQGCIYTHTHVSYFTWPTRFF